MSPAFSQTDLRRIPRETFVEEVWYRRELGSTNDLALDLASASRELPLLVLAERQTAGRGRGANRWWSGDGGLTFSLVIDWPTTSAAAVGPTPLAPSAGNSQRGRGTGWMRVSLAAALAVHDVLCVLVPDKRVGLKWPNDVFLANRKICGILIELRPDTANRLVLGIGLNVNNSFRDAPDVVRQLGTSLCDATGAPLVMTRVLIALLDSLATRLKQLREERLELVRAWQPHCALSGHWIEIDSGSRKTLGRCNGIAEDGALLLDTESGRQRCYSGVVRRVEP